MSATQHLVAFGARVHELRLIRGWSKQGEFAEHVGMDRTYLSGIERGRRNPTLGIIVRLAAGLGVPPSELLATLPAQDVEDDS